MQVRGGVAVRLNANLHIVIPNWTSTRPYTQIYIYTVADARFTIFVILFNRFKGTLAPPTTQMQHTVKWYVRRRPAGDRLRPGENRISGLAVWYARAPHRPSSANSCLPKLIRTPASDVRGAHHVQAQLFRVSEKRNNYNNNNMLNPTANVHRDRRDTRDSGCAAVSPRLLCSRTNVTDARVT